MISIDNSIFGYGGTTTTCSGGGGGAGGCYAGAALGSMQATQSQMASQQYNQGLQTSGLMGASNQYVPQKFAQICPYSSGYPIYVSRSLEKDVDTLWCSCDKCKIDRVKSKDQEYKIADTGKEIKMADVGKDNEILPDISLARVFKWAIVLVVAMGLGNRIWSMFGPRIESNLKSALGAIEGKGESK